jgi:hypothetical protein
MESDDSPTQRPARVFSKSVLKPAKPAAVRNIGRDMEMERVKIKTEIDRV